MSKIYIFVSQQRGTEFESRVVAIFRHTIQRIIIAGTFYQLPDLMVIATVTDMFTGLVRPTYLRPGRVLECCMRADKLHHSVHWS